VNDPLLSRRAAAVPGSTRIGTDTRHSVGKRRAAATVA